MPAPGLQAIVFLAQAARFRFEAPRPRSPFALPQPRGHAPKKGPNDDETQDHCKQRERYHERRIGWVEGIKRDRDRLAIGNRKPDKHDRERKQNKCREGPADCGHAVLSPWAVIPEAGRD